VNEHKVGTREEWQAARDELLEREKEHTRLGDELARQRRELPWVRIEKEYGFLTDEGTKTLSELFEGCSQLLIYHFMFGPAYQAGCPTCSAIADNIDANVVHLRARDVTMICASRAPLAKLQAYKDRMGWRFGWVSTADADFNFDFGASHSDTEARAFLEATPEEELRTTPIGQFAQASGTDAPGYLTEEPGLTAFARSDGVVYQTYYCTARGVEPLMGFYSLLDRAPKGRNEGASFQFWLRRHDEYDHAGP
jgi:predicted dithiol-disulfide oxidoreductase (DUF899 family)